MKGPNTPSGSPVISEAEKNAGMTRHEFLELFGNAAKTIVGCTVLAGCGAALPIVQNKPKLDREKIKEIKGEEICELREQPDCNPNKAEEGLQPPDYTTSIRCDGPGEPNAVLMNSERLNQKDIPNGETIGTSSRVTEEGSIVCIQSGEVEWEREKITWIEFYLRVLGGLEDLLDRFSRKEKNKLIINKVKFLLARKIKEIYSVFDQINSGKKVRLNKEIDPNDNARLLFNQILQESKVIGNPDERGLKGMIESLKGGYKKMESTLSIL